jgi:hypothetical protein
MPVLAGMTAAVFVTLAIQVLLNNRGMRVGTIWQNMSVGDPPNLRAALVWWVVAGSALVVGAAVTALLTHYPAPWHRLRAARWVLSGIGLLALAHVAHEANAPEGVGAMAQLGSTTIAVLLAALMAVFGAIFALRSQ